MTEAVELSYVVARGDGAGARLTPHLHEDGKYVASMTRFEKDYIRVESIRELGILVEHGFSVRMSDVGTAPSLIKPGSLQVSLHVPAVEA